jgi:cobalt/nickel transport protein
MRIFVISILLLGMLSGAALAEPETKWPGVDESVVKKFADGAGRPAWEPFLNLEGDAQLFAFLMAGLVGGFTAGYYFRHLFPPKPKSSSGTEQQEYS